jgi:hypothetical protein
VKNVLWEKSAQTVVSLYGFHWRDGKKPMVIGKATKPQGFRYINTEKLPVHWKSNKKKKKKPDIVQEWLATFNAIMKQQQPNVPVFLQCIVCMAFPQHKCTSKCVMMIYCTLLE